MDGSQVGSIGKGRFTLPKDERLASRSEIERLFTQGEAFLVYPVKCTYLFRPAGDGSRVRNRIMVIAPKRNHKRAVARNLLKRRMREAYRLNKHLVMGEGSGAEVDIAFSYIAKGDPLDYGTIEKAVVSILNKLCTIRDNATQRLAGALHAEK